MLKLKYLVYLLVFAVICWQTYVHLDLSTDKRHYNPLDKLTSMRKFTLAKTLSEEKAIISEEKYPRLLNYHENNHLITLGHVDYLKNIWLDLQLTKDNNIIIVPQVDLKKLSNITLLYPEVEQQDGDINLSSLTWKQLQQVEFYQDGYTWLTLEQYIQASKDLNITLWLNLTNASKFYLQENRDFASLVYQTVKNEQIAPERVNFISNSLLILSHLSRDFIRVDKLAYNLAFYITPGLDIPKEQPDVNLGYTSFVPVANKVILDESYAIAEINGDYKLINDWYTQLLFASKKPIYLYADSLKNSHQLFLNYNLILSSKFKGIISQFNAQDLHFAR
ncbi:hypothetical protein CKF54_01820 [Psittacicella hinzii]|uniref:Uncharacterized protein n=1 Tax=Psittacicella hinzii TaxID=2028575 RepID=A0A3A1Y9S7_9GAMM|nr:hypothetical protein [Psittacicella hinzii]RIY33979.1 hypothetical protein CKF54_01820 [Psittacicella hinzii]